MSHLLDYLCKPASKEHDIDINTFMDFEEEMNNFELPLNIESQELMSSDFFDSVFSMERENFNRDVESSLLNVSSETSHSEGSTHLDDADVQSPLTVSTDSDNSYFLTSDSKIYKNDEEFIGATECISFDNPKILNTTDDQMLRTLATKLVVRHPNMKRVIVSKPMINSNGKKIQKNKQIITVQPLTGNGRSLLVPINVKNVKKIKIINANDLKIDNFKIGGPTTVCQSFLKKSQIDKYPASSSESVDDETECEIDGNNRYPPLNLTSEEKRLLLKEGIQLPSHYPLTKNEEKELKRIRRKIRNKISAQDSRKRKKEYVDKLEEKAKRTSEENEVLKKRIKLLRKQNGRLMEQMRKLQTVLFSTTATKASPTTCLMIVLFSTLLVCLPNLRVSENKELGEQQLFAARRALLFNQKANEEEGVNMEDFLVFNKEDDAELENFDDESENSTSNEFANFLSELAEKYGNLSDDKNYTKESGYNQQNMEDFCRKYEDEIKNVINSMKEFFEVNGRGGKKRSFIEPDISDDECAETKWKHSASHLSSIKEEPPSKRMKFVSDLNFELLKKINHPDGEEVLTTVESKLYNVKQE